MFLNNRHDFHKLLKSKGLEGSYIEIGVFRGEFSNYLLNNTSVKKLFLVDPYKNFETEQYQDAINKLNMDFIYRNCQIYLSPFKERIQFVRQTSAEAASNFEDLSMDFVYIDGNHAYDYVMQDLELYWPKVKVGGILAGDDVYSTNEKENLIFWDGQNDINVSNSYGIYGVYNAVKDFCAKNNLKCNFFSNQFYIEK